MDHPALADDAAKLGWFHSIPLGNELHTKGVKTPEQLAKEARSWRFPDDLTGKTVLDIGCADGYWSHLALARGAKSVLAIDEQVTGGLRFLLDRGFYKFEFRQIDIFAPEFLTLPRFDFVIFAGVIYHARHPLLSLERLRRVVGATAIVESLLDNRFGDASPAMVYYGNAADRIATWGPNLPCLTAMLHTAGFGNIETTDFYHGPPPYDRVSFLVS